MLNKYVLVAAIGVGAVLGAGFQQTRIANLKASHAKVLKNLAESTKATYEAVIKADKLRTQQLAIIRKDNHAEVQKLQDELSKTASVRDAYIDRVRKLSKRINSSPTTSNSRSGGPSKSDQATFDLFTKLLSRDSEALAAVGDYADRLRQAGLMCERVADVQSPTQK